MASPAAADPVPYQPPAHGFRTFVIMWATQSLSVLGSALTLFAANIWLTQTLYPRPEQKPALAFALAATSLAYALPPIVGAPLAGAWVDRHDRRRTMFAADVVSGLLCLLLAGLLATGTLNLWMLVALLALISAAGAFHYAAFDTSYAMLVSERQLPRANGMMRTMDSVSFLFAPALAATLIGLPALARDGTVPIGWLGHFTDGAALAIGLDGITFLFTATVLLFLAIPSPSHTLTTAIPGKRPSLLADARSGFAYIWQRRPLLWLLGTFAVANLTLTPVGVLQPLLVKYALAADWSARGFTYESALALLGTFLGLGGLTGGVLVSVWGGLKTRRIYGVLVPMLAQGIAQVVFGLSPLLYLSAGVVLIAGLTNALVNVHSQAIWQTQTPRELQGRVFSARRVIAQATFPLSAGLAGLLGGIFEAGTVIAASGALLALFCGAQLFNRTLLRVEDRAWLEQLAAGRVQRM